MKYLVDSSVELQRKSNVYESWTLNDRISKYLEQYSHLTKLFKDLTRRKPSEKLDLRMWETIN